VRRERIPEGAAGEQRDRRQRDQRQFLEFSTNCGSGCDGGPIEVPDCTTVKTSINVIELDLQAVVKRIASDLAQSTRSRRAEPVTFQAKWVPAAIHQRVTENSAARRCNSLAHRHGNSSIAA
jgi:hypothetical protein